MAFYWAGEVFVLWVCLAAFTRHPPSIPAVVVGYATGYALTRRTLPLAGAGAVEALLPFALVWVGFRLSAAVLAVFAYRIFNLWLPIGPAAVGLWHLQRRAPEAGAGPLVPHAEVGRDDRHAPSLEGAGSVRDGDRGDADLAPPRREQIPQMRGAGDPHLHRAHGADVGEAQSRFSPTVQYE